MSKLTRRSLLGLALLAAFHLREALVLGRVLFERDIHLQWYGQVESFVRAVVEGALPLWDPYVSFGQPMLANANTQILYPLTWLNLLMRPWTYFTFYVLLHVLLAGAGILALSRRFGVSPAGSFFAAAFWISSGPLLSLVNTWNHLAGAAFLPWIVLAAEGAVERGGLRPTLAFGLSMALPLLAGSPDFLLMAAAPVACSLAARLDIRRPLGPRSRRLLFVAAGASLFALLLAAGQLLPSLELASRSHRLRISVSERTYWSVHPAVALQTLVPLAFNELPLLPEHRAAAFESREPYLLSLYLGLPALALAAAGLSARGHPRRILLGVVTLAGLLLALGRHTPFYELAAAAFPPLRMVRFPAKAMVLVAFGMALLAGGGFDAWRSGARGRFWGRLARACAGLGVVLAALAALLWLEAAAIGPLLLERGTDGPAWRDMVAPAAARLLAVALLAALVFLCAQLRRRGPEAAALAAFACAAGGLMDLAVRHRDLNSTAPRGFFAVKPDVIAALDQGDLSRALVFDYTMAEDLAPRYLKRERPYMVGAPRDPRALWRGAMGTRIYPVAPVTGGFRLFSSYGRDFLDLQPEALARLNDYVTLVTGTETWLKLLRTGAVSHLVTLHTVGLEALPLLGSFHGPFFEDIRLFRVPDALPRAYLVSGARIGDDPQLLGEPGFDPRRETLLASGTPRPVNPDFSGQARIVEMAADRLRIDLTASSAGFLVLVDTYDPGWVAALDGSPTTVLRANCAFRAVAVPAGRHSVEMTYRPASVGRGLAVSGIALAGALLLFLRAGRARRPG